MSVVVQRLVDRRLVVKVAAPDDRRRANLAITEAGAAVLRESPEPAQDRLIAAIAALDEPLRRALAQALAEIAGTMGAPAPAAMFFEDVQAPAATRTARTGDGSRRKRRS